MRRMLHWLKTLMALWALITAGAGCASGTAAEPEQAATTTIVEGAGGERLYSEERGRKGAPPVVLVHGLMGDHTTWEALAAELSAAGYRVVTPDLRGHGRSGRPAAPAAYAGAAVWAAAGMR